MGIAMSEILVGTSGYSYADWRGTFYPEDLPTKEMLQYYAKVFNCVELNFTYYGIPNPRVISAMVKATPTGFRFAVKANEATTHKLDPSVLDSFKEAVEPAKVAQRLAGVLCQFPYAFRNTEQNRAYLAQLAKDLADFKPIIEFRHDSWIKPAVFDFLRANRLAYCSVDEPQIPGLVPRIAKVTSDIAYLRFHSRDASKWFGGEGKGRYDYLYTKEEMSEWLPKVKDLDSEAQSTYIFFNNCHAGSAAINATEFKQMLAEMGLLKE